MKRPSRTVPAAVMVIVTLLIGTVGVVPEWDLLHVEDAHAATKPTCKAGSKPGKTAVSLVPGAKVSCVNSAAAVLGKKLLISNKNTCFACHAVGGIAPYTSMLSNLRDQSYTLKPSDITAAFNAHSAEMAGATITAKDAKNISQYLQTLKLP